MMPTVSQGGATSGNSSVLSFTSAKMPKMTIDTIATTVISGRLIAKSEMIIGSPMSLLARRIRGGAHLHRRLLRDTTRCSEQNRVARRHARFHLDRFGRPVANSQLHFGLRHHAVLDAHYE